MLFLILQTQKTVCNKCGKVGHLQKVHKSKQSKATRKPPKPVNNVQDDATNGYQLLNITLAGKATPWNVTVDIQGPTVLIQLDTGASLSLMSEGSTFKEQSKRNITICTVLVANGWQVFTIKWCCSMQRYDILCRYSAI